MQTTEFFETAIEYRKTPKRAILNENGNGKKGIFENETYTPKIEVKHERDHKVSGELKGEQYEGNREGESMNDACSDGSRSSVSWGNK